ncbi:hypothetical protein N7513_004160 [Penicillium frequentans]|nr:hypothetical protein N7513_004160 [Penicillium glabrum]
MATRGPIRAPKDSEAYTKRVTRDGRELTYQMVVMQQPERARACGAGAKSSADRRPVDPPPVVELRIFETDPNNPDKATDVTFAYNANFFLYATLENARNIAHGRMAGPPSCPVLTGVPVAGVAYLDRPLQAGYFIFPDLSVRHEGRYRLSFHLYEEIKDTKDTDKDSDLPLPNQVTGPNTTKPGSPQSFLHFRLEVKSVPFVVYSAKKFPGLATSTSLSRIIAEQGCRVRIRRDVRMRRRGDKHNEEYDFDENRNAAAYARSDRFSTPDHYVVQTVERPRSNSHTSTGESPYGYPPEIQRRPSAQDYAFACPQPYQRPMPPVMANASTPSYQSHLSFGSTPTHYPAAAHMPPTPPPPGVYSPHTAYANIRHQSTASEYDMTPGGYPMAPQMQNGYPKNNMNQYRVEAAKPTPYLIQDPSQYLPPAHMMRPDQTPNMGNGGMPVIKSLASEYANVQPSIEGIPPSPSGGYDSFTGKRMVYHTGNIGSKRTHEDSFGIDDRSMQNGMRPDTEPNPNAYRDFSAESRAALMAEFGVEMAYKRANGKMVMKAPQ